MPVCVGNRAEKFGSRLAGQVVWNARVFRISRFLERSQAALDQRK